MSLNNCQIKNSRQKGVGLYSMRQFKKGDVVYICQIEKDNIQNNSHASQVDMEKWVKFTLLGRSINHSCDPNCGIGFDGINWCYKALKDIQNGEQLTYDYAMANYHVQNITLCLCGSPICRKEVKGFKNLPKDKKKSYKGYFAPYLEKMAEEEINQID